MARALTADEKQRYPWASRINDFVPVGRWRKLGLWTSVGGLVALALGTGGIYLTAADVRVGVDLTGGLPGRITLGVGGTLLAAGFVLGLVTAVEALVKNARSPLVWSVTAMAPGVAVALVVLLAF